MVIANAILAAEANNAKQAFHRRFGNAPEIVPGEVGLDFASRQLNDVFDARGNRLTSGMFSR